MELIKFNDNEPDLTFELISQNVRQAFPIRFAIQFLRLKLNIFFI